MHRWSYTITMSSDNHVLTAPIMPFDTANEWRAWLDKNHTMPGGVWLQMYKKYTKIPSIDYAAALDEALCYGWIDGQKKSYDEQSWLQKFTPRRPKSIWSKVNIGHIKRLTKEAKMRPAGLAAVKLAQQDGRWQQAYDSPKNMVMPKDFIAELAKYPGAYSFFTTLNKTNTYAIAWRLQTAKRPETRAKRMKLLVEMMQRGEKLH